MEQDITARRNFLRLAGVGAAATALTLGAREVEAETSPGAGVAGVFDVKAFGATGDGKALDTDAVNRAIAAAAAAGGGTVRFSAGTYLCYSIHLKSNVELYLGRGVTILAADSPTSAVSSGYYDQAEENPAADHYQDFGHTHFHNSLIWGEGIENVSILGPGLIYGRGLSKGYGPGPKAENQGVGNKSIALKNCRNVILRDFAILQGGHFGILATGVDNFTIDNLTIDTNRDGMDIDCCRNVRVSNCTVNSPWDDGICLKSSYALGYARATEMVTITNCFVSAYVMGSVLDASFKPVPEGSHIPRTGRIKFGTESNGGFKNITISNCVFEECQGLALETVDGALLEDITITNISMHNITSAPLYLRLGERLRGPAESTKVGTLKRVVISNITCSHSSPRLCSILSGIPGYAIEGVKLSNIVILYNGGGTKEQAALQPREHANGYPEPGEFGPMPAYGFFVRHVKDIEFDHVEIQTAAADARPAFVLNDVEGIDITHLKATRAAGVPAFSLHDVRDFSLERSRPLADIYLEKVEDKQI